VVFGFLMGSIGSCECALIEFRLRDGGYFMKRMLMVLVVLWISVFCPVRTNAITRHELSNNLNQYLRDQYGSVSESPISTGILYDLVLPMSGIERVNGSETSATIQLNPWLQMAHELRRATIGESPLPTHKELREIGRLNVRNNIHPIAILNFRYQRVREDADMNKALQFDGDHIISIDEDAFEEKRAFAVSALHNRTYHGREVQFRMDSTEFYFSNESAGLRSLEIDFDDGRGLHRVDLKGDVVAQYGVTGMKTIRVRIIQSDGVILHGSFDFDVRSLDTPVPNETWQVQATIPFMGIYASGEAYILLSDQHTTLTRPIILAEGLDFDNSLNWDELYELLNQENMLETLRAIGYDAVVLNYTESTTYIQANAFLVAELIQQVNQAVNSDYNPALVGASMGGLTTRYALTYMEANGQPHHIRTLITFDAPHGGADIPLGIQYWADFFAEESADAELMRDALNSPAARQLLVTHFTDPPSSVPSSDPLRAEFMADLAQIGSYPSQVRKVAVANGSSTMQGSGFNPGDQLILYEYESILVDIIGNVWALHNAQSQLIFDGAIDLIWPLPDRFLSVTVEATWPWDNAPGGLTSSMQAMDEAEVPYGDVIALHDDHCFIPTISALDLNVTDPFYNIAADSNLYSLTAFDSLYYPVENQFHVEITPQNYWWFLQEIAESLPTPEIVASFDGGMIHIQWQPISGARSYHVYATDDLAVWPESYLTTDETDWMFPLSSGMQFYRIVASTEPITPFH
jgi:pimeloyl-ACP methyl ester carboxylesterase